MLYGFHFPQGHSHSFYFVQLSIFVDFFVVYIYKVKFSIIMVMVATCGQKF